MDVNKLTNLELDVLREIGNIGAGNAATSMSTLINKRVNMKVPDVNIVTFDEMMEIVGGPEQLIVAMFFRIHGDAPSTVYFILTIEEAEELIKQVTNQDHISLLSLDQPNEIALSALKEVSNIMTGSYLSALADFTDMNMQSSIPYLSIDMASAVLTAGLVELSYVSDYAIVINTEISDQLYNNGLSGNFFLLPDPETIPKLFNALGIDQYD